VVGVGCCPSSSLLVVFVVVVFDFAELIDEVIGRGIGVDRHLAVVILLVDVYCFARVFFLFARLLLFGFIVASKAHTTGFWGRRE